MGNLTLQFIPYQDIAAMSSLGRIRKLLKLTKEDKIVLLEGRLKKEEETELIKTTMEQIDNEFKGIELAVIYPGSQRTEDAIQWVKNNVISMVLGDRVGFTVIGPASVVKEIRQAPEKIQVYTKDIASKKGAKKKKRGR